MTSPRAYCKAGAAGGRLFVVGGVHRGGGSLQPLVSGEVFDPEKGEKGEWGPIPDMTFKTAPVRSPFTSGYTLREVVLNGP